MIEETVISIHDTIGDAKHAINALRKGGFPTDQISLLARDLGDSEELHGFALQGGDNMGKDAVFGAGIGGLLGVLAGAAFFWIPGFGPLIVAGPIAMAFTGSMVGALVGAMSGWGIPEETLQEYEKQVRDGKFLIAARGNPEEAALAKTLLQEVAPDRTHLHAAPSGDPPETVEK